jgi:hypothetical protein
MLCRIYNASVANFLLARGFLMVHKVGISGLMQMTGLFLANYNWEVIGLSSLQS